MVVMALTAHTASARWHAVTQPGDFDGPVYDMCVFRGELIVAGSFSRAGGVPARNIAAFDGERWRPLRGGIGTPPTPFGEFTWGEALAVYQDELWVGGRFGEVDGKPIQFLARWDGAQWRGMDSQPGARVTALEVVGGAIYVGGLFAYVGPIEVNYISRYNGRWATLEQGTVGGVLDIGAFDGDLYVGGLFSGTSRVTSPGAVVWRDSNWFGFSRILDSSDGHPVAVFDFHEHDGEFFACGHFHRYGSTKASGIARLVGNAWRSVDDGLGLFDGVLSPNQMISFAGDLVVVGRFESAGRQGGQPRQVNNIARLVDGEWRGMGGGTDNEIKCVAEYQASLYFGGFFARAGGVNSPIVARWANPKAPAPAITQLSMRSANPTDAGAVFALDLATAADVSWSVFDLRGARVASARLPAGTHELSWDGRAGDGRSLPRGVYFMSVEFGGERSVRKLTLLRND